MYNHDHNHNHNLILDQIQVTLTSKGKGIESTEEAPPFQLGPLQIEVISGEFLVILGPSGSGKSTLLRAIVGLDALVSGSIRLGTNDMTNVPPEKRGLGMVFQQPLLFPHLTVEDNIAFGLKMEGVQKKERLLRANELLTQVELVGYGSRYPSELSGGQQQRVALARALAIQPRILLMDEPFSALDPNLREEMGRLVNRLHAQFHMTIVFVTHDQDEAFRLAHRIAIMQDGKITQVDTPQNIYEHPLDASIAAFLGIKNIWLGIVDQGIFMKDSFRLELPSSQRAFSGQLVQAVIRPEALHIIDHLTDVRSHRLQGTVVEVQYRQGFIVVQVRISSEIVYVIANSSTVRLPNHGDSITLAYDPESILLFAI
jgi:ABC-type Fe3+/spermidine/putrescine transport system ATPase subunit